MNRAIKHNPRGSELLRRPNWIGTVSSGQILIADQLIKPEYSAHSALPPAFTPSHTLSCTPKEQRRSKATLLTWLVGAFLAHFDQSRRDVGTPLVNVHHHTVQSPQYPPACRPSRPLILSFDTVLHCNGLRLGLCCASFHISTPHQPDVSLSTHSASDVAHPYRSRTISKNIIPDNRPIAISLYSSPHIVGV